MHNLTGRQSNMMLRIADVLEKDPAISSQQAIADALGVTHATVGQCYRVLAKHGVFDRVDGRIVVGRNGAKYIERARDDRDRREREKAQGYNNAQRHRYREIGVKGSWGWQGLGTRGA